MAGIETAGIVLPGDIQAEYYSDTTWFMQNYYVNQFPLISRLKRMPVTTPTFEVRHTKYRPRKYPVGATMDTTAPFAVLTLANQTNPQLGIGDSTSLMAGDIIDLAGERVEVMATPAMDPGAIPKLPNGTTLPAAGTVLVRRGAEGTTVAAHATSVVGTLIGNSRDGGEVNQSGLRARPISQTQYVQNFQAPVQISGSVDSTRGYGQAPGGMFEVAKAQQLDNMMRDMEKSSFYGLGEALNLGVDGSGNPLNIRQKQIGIKKQVVTNRITAPTNASAYTSFNFITDVLSPLWAVGSAPDIMLCAADFLAGLTVWSHTAMRIDVGQTALGLKIDAFVSNLAPGITIIPCISLNPGELFVGMSEYMYWRVKQVEDFWARGIRGYAIEGDWVAEGAVELRDEEKHAFVSGITGYSGS